MTQTTDRPAPCLLDACTRQCTTECREAINRAWTSLRGELPPATHLAPTEPVPPSSTEQLQGGRRIAPTLDRPGINQLRNLADRAERHGPGHGLTGEEATRLRDGINQLNDWITTARAAARAEKQRAERAEATLTAVRAIADRWAESDVEVLRRAALVLAKEALDQHGQTPKETT